MIALVLLACASVDDPVGAVDSSSPGDRGGAGGTGGSNSSGASGYAGASNLSGAPGYPGGAGGSPAGGAAGTGGTPEGPVCTRTDERLQVTLEQWDGVPYGCGTHPDKTPNIFDAQITQITQVADGERITLTSPCGPGLECPTSHLTVKIPGQSFPAPVGVFVRLNLAIWSGTGGPSCCFVRLEVTNLSSLDGVVNPVDPVDHLWLAGADANLADSPLEGLTVEKVAQECPSEHPAGCGAGAIPDDYRLRFIEASSSIDVTMGQPVAWSPPSAKGRTWTVLNTHSFYSGICDDYCKFGYVITSP
ncbi:MAG: hypothetical protein EOO75_07690 [Myxococcales bacterium]|nr:MAG: hypothetical protein EOO75_07690 [Myxococcales bacterium]